MKRFTYEGGHRVPGIISWPGTLPDNQVSDALVNGTDFLPTICNLLNIPLPDGKTICFECVTTCDRNIVDHLKACFIDSDQVSEVRIVTYLKSEHANLQKKIDAVPELEPFGGRIIYESLEDYVKELWP